MKRIQLSSLVLTLLFASAAHAFLPDPPITLSDHINISEYIFVAEVVDVYFVSSYGKPISPRQAARQMDTLKRNPWIESKLRVRETLLTRRGQLPDFIYFRYPTQGAFYFQKEARQAGLTKWISDDKEDFGKPFIYFADFEKRPKRSIFFASYGMTIGKEVKEKAKIQAAIEDSKDSMRLLN